MQAEKGENTTERPMWAEKGGLDFEGRAKWDAWTANKGMASAKARLQLVKVGWMQLPAKGTLDISGPENQALIGVLPALLQEYYEFPVKALYSDTRP